MGDGRIFTLGATRFRSRLSHARKTERERQDAIQLTRIGKRPVLKRSFGFLPLLGFSCVVLVTWEGVLLSYGIAYENGGPAGTVYSFIFVWLGTLCSYLCLGELASMAPTSGGQYHWVSMLSPKSCQKFLSYLAGWLTATGWQASSASGAYNSGILIQGLMVLCNSQYTSKNWVTTLLAFAVLGFALFINIATTTTLAKFEGSILFLHIIGFFAILIPMVSLAPHVDAHDVFVTYIDGAGWGSNGYSFFIGLIAMVYGFVGGDSAMHMAEEIQNAAVVLPKALIATVLINGSLGFAMLIAILFCMGPPADAGAIFGTNILGFAFVQVFLDATRSVPGTAVMASIVLVMGISSTVGLVAATSRMFWAFARDRGLPFSSYICRVNSRTSLPNVAVITTTIISALLALIGLGSPLAFNILVSVTVVGLVASYILPLGLLLWRRATGAIHDSASDSGLVNTINTPEGQLTWGPFRMPHTLGIIVNALAIVYLLIIFIFAFWPPALPVDASHMNYSCLIFGATILFCVFWYMAVARKKYVGPVIETSMREEAPEEMQEEET